MINQTTIMETLSYLQGENTVPTTGVDNRRRFIQKTLEEVYRAYPWTFASATATLTVSNSIATLPSDLDYQHKVYAYFYDGDDETEVYEISEADRDGFQQNDYKFWLTPQSDGTYLLNTKDSNYSQVIVNYQTVAPEINASIQTPFADDMTVALGARRYVKLGQNPDADISQDEALFQKRLTENIAAVQLSRPKKMVRKIYEANDYVLGEG